MILDHDEQNIYAWKSDMKHYEKNKRTKLPFGRDIPKVEHVTYEYAKEKESLFNPVLQTYKRPEDEADMNAAINNKRTMSLIKHFNNTAKYAKDFDIVNLYPRAESTAATITNRKLAPIRNAYNVINNQKLPDFYFKNRELQLQVTRDKKLLPAHQKDYNIVTNVYKESHEERVEKELQEEKEKILDKYWQTHDYDAVFGKYYDPNKEAYEIEKEKLREAVHGQDASKKLPPSYNCREPFISDFTKPISDNLKLLDYKNANAKRRFQMKYILQDEYERRNLYEYAKHEQQIKNKVHFGRVLDEKSKEFDIITNKKYDENRAESLYGKKLQVANWDQLLKETVKYSNKLISQSGPVNGGNAFAIKSKGF